MIRGLDVSHHQDPKLFDWAALRASGVEFMVARAAYGKTLDRQFVAFAERVRSNGIKFGAYLFYRQTQTVEEQLAAFNKQLELIGGLKTGDMFPVLDMEDNAANGDGQVNPVLFSNSCFSIANSWREQYGGAILYYSSYFPQKLTANAMWRNTPGFYHWLADYGTSAHPTPPGQPRNPYTPVWHLHQPLPSKDPAYVGGSVVVDHDVANPTLNEISSLLIGDQNVGEPIDVADIYDRPGVLFVDEFDAGIELMKEGTQKMLEGLTILSNIKRS